MVLVRKTLTLAVLATTLALATAEPQTGAVVAADAHARGVRHHKTHHHRGRRHHRGHHKNKNSKHRAHEDDESVEAEAELAKEESPVAKASLDVSDSADIEADESADIDADGDADIDVDDNGESVDVDIDESASLDSDESVDVDGSLEDGSISVDFTDSEDYDQSVDLASDQELDESIDIPEGVKKMRLRVANGKVDLELIKSAPVTKVKAASLAAAAGAAKPLEMTVEHETIAQQASEWIKANSSKPAFLVGAVGAAVVMIGAAGVAVAKSRKTTAVPKSVLDLEAAEEQQQAASDEQDADASSSDDDSDDGAEGEEETADAEERETEAAPAAGVVEGSV